MKLGIIGGAGPLATSLFYQTLILESYRMKKSLPELYLLHYPFKRGEKREILKRQLQDCLTNLKKNGVQKAIVVCNTLHLVLPDFDFFLIPKIVGKKLLPKAKALLLGTKETCLSELYPQISKLADEDQKMVEDVIERILIGRILQKDSQTLGKLCEGFDQVILGCTELPVLHHHFPLPTKAKILDSIKIPAQEIVESL